MMVDIYKFRKDDETVGMRRRTFLKMMAAAGVVAALPAADVLVPPEEAIEAAHAADKLISGDIAFRVGAEKVLKDGRYSMVGGTWTRVGKMISMQTIPDEPEIYVSYLDVRMPRSIRGVSSNRLKLQIEPGIEGAHLARECLINMDPTPIRMVLGNHQFTCDDFLLNQVTIEFNTQILFDEEEPDVRMRRAKSREDSVRKDEVLMVVDIEGMYSKPPVIEIA